MKRYLIPILMTLVLISGMAAGCGQQEQPSGSLTPITKPAYAVLRGYLGEAQSIVKEHDRTMNTALEAIETIKTILVPREMKTINQMTPEEIAAVLFAKDRFEAAIQKMEGALQKMGSEIVDFGILAPPTEAEAYHRLMANSFLKDQVALKDWLYYYKLVQEHRNADEDVLQRAGQHYQDAKQFRAQAEQELERLLKMIEQ